MFVPDVGGGDDETMARNDGRGRCQLTATIFNRNGMSSPFDVE
jgi:hypothetical protein